MVNTHQDAVQTADGVLSSVVVLGWLDSYKIAHSR